MNTKNSSPQRSEFLHKNLDKAKVFDELKRRMRDFAADTVKTGKVFTLFGSRCYFNSFTHSLSPKHLLFELVSGPLRRLRGVQCLSTEDTQGVLKSDPQCWHWLLGSSKGASGRTFPPSRTVPSYLFLLQQGNLHYPLLDKN